MLQLGPHAEPGSGQQGLDDHGGILNNGRTYTDVLKVGAARPAVSILDYFAGRYRHSSREVWADHVRTGRVTLGLIPMPAFFFV
jgi:hypothetical protein